MNRLDIETYGNNFSDSTVIFNLSVIFKSNLPWYTKIYGFGYLVGLVRSEEILNISLSTAFDLELLDNYEKINDKLSVIKFKDFKTSLRVKSICYGELIQYNASRKYWKMMEYNPKDLIIEVTEDAVFSNLPDIEESAGKDSVMRKKNKIINMPSQDATIETDEILSCINDIHYRFDTKIFKKEKKYYRDLKPLIATLNNTKKTDGEPGRPNFGNKNAVDYLINYDITNALKYIQTLKSLLLSDSFFQNSPSPKKFNYLLFALHELGDINLNLGEIENIFNAFKQNLSKDYLKSCKHKGSIQNFRNQKNKAKEIILLKKIKSLIIDLKEEKVIIRKSKLS